MRHPNEDQPQDLLPKMVIQKSNASPVPQKTPLTKSNYEPVAQHIRSRVPHTVDHPPPRVSKSPDTGRINRHTRSQTAAIANVITPYKAARRKNSA